MDDVSIIFFLMALAIAVTILHTFLKQSGRDEFAYLALVAGLAVALVRVLPVRSNSLTACRRCSAFMIERAYGYHQFDCFHCSGH